VPKPVLRLVTGLYDEAKHSLNLILKSLRGVLTGESERGGSAARNIAGQTSQLDDMPAQARADAAHRRAYEADASIVEFKKQQSKSRTDRSQA
jgi:hypothetical protein